MRILSMKDIHKQFDAMGVLKGISLDVRQGEVVAVLGPSGSGKSTLLRCATLLEEIDSGFLGYMDMAVAQNDQSGRARYADAPTLKKARSMFGLVFQNFNLFPHYSVIRNITDAPLSVQKRGRDQVMAEARELLKKMGLSDREDAYPYQLSGGQQQRVSIARALAMNPKILFFDEPTSALDPELTGDILHTIRALAAERMTMVIVTHEIGFAKNVADRVVFMDDGVILEEGTPAQVIDHPSNDRTRIFLSRLQK
ncbi:MAG: amino acid ABC transporter ATP-binding protein [Christensenellales bacterium]|jgi:polar amino acid transport system ATP-binding protein